MASITGLAKSGTTGPTECQTCGGECASPDTHVFSDRNTSQLLRPDDRVRLYAEMVMHGRRIRVMRVYRENEVRAFVDDMGDPADFIAEPILIPSAGDNPNDWNTVGECLEEAQHIHDIGGLQSRRKQTRRATGAEWAAELAQQNSLIREELAARSTYGAGGHFQRDRSWRR